MGTERNRQHQKVTPIIRNSLVEPGETVIDPIPYWLTYGNSWCIIFMHEHIFIYGDDGHERRGKNRGVQDYFCT